MNTSLITSERETMKLAHYVRMVGYLVKQNLGEDYVCLSGFNMQYYYMESFTAPGAAVNILESMGVTA